MDGKIKIIIAVAAVAAIGMAGYNKLAGDLNQDPPITSLQAEFVGEVKPGQTFTKRMFDAVSYTHLDVYKRQSATQFSKLDCFAGSVRVCRCILRSVSFAPFPFTDTHSAVSRVSIRVCWIF